MEEETDDTEEAGMDIEALVNRRLAPMQATIARQGQQIERQNQTIQGLDKKLDKQERNMGDLTADVRANAGPTNERFDKLESMMMGLAVTLQEVVRNGRRVDEPPAASRGRGV